MNSRTAIAELKKISGLSYGGRKNGVTKFGFYVVQDGQEVAIKFFSAGYKHLASHAEKFFPIVEESFAGKGYRVSKIVDASGRVELKVGA